MTEQELGIAIDNAFKDDKLEETERLKQERMLFRQSILLQPVSSGLNRTPSSFQISQAWQRWKRERFLEIGVDNNIDTSKLYERKQK